jgi:hypothetical protein
VQHRDWYSADPRRRVPEIDYGTVWTDRDRSDDQWSVSWNPGTGELYTFNRRTGDVDVIAVYPTRRDVDEALEGWGRHALEPDGLTWLHQHVSRLQRADPAVFGVVASTDGRLELLTEPVDVDDARRLLGGNVAMITATALTPHSPAGELMMFLDDDGHAKNLPANATGTALYGTGWTIRGDAVICRADDRSIGYDDLIHLLTRRVDRTRPESERLSVDRSKVIRAESGRLLHPVRDPDRGIVGAVYADPPLDQPGAGTPGGAPDRAQPPPGPDLSL